VFQMHINNFNYFKFKIWNIINTLQSMCLQSIKVLHHQRKYQPFKKWLIFKQHLARNKVLKQLYIYLNMKFKQIWEFYRYKISKHKKDIQFYLIHIQLIINKWSLNHIWLLFLLFQINIRKFKELLGRLIKYFLMQVDYSQ